MSIALLQRLHARTFTEHFTELRECVDALDVALDEVGRLAADRDRIALERLERIAERLGGLQRVAMLARTALDNELRPPEAA